MASSETLSASSGSKLPLTAVLTNLDAPADTPPRVANFWHWDGVQTAVEMTTSN
jgi:hypothetical protein